MPQGLADGRTWRLQRIAIALVFAATVTVLALLGFSTLFSVVANYDDEGCMLLTVKELIAGRPLYDEVASMYGPFPFFVRWAMFAALGQPVGHDAGRVICMGFWFATAAACAGVAWRLTRSAFAAWAGLLFGFQVLWLIVYEPGHPQELCVLVLALALLLTTWAGQAGRHAWVLAAVMGGLAACVAMSKINVFIFMMMALGAAAIPCTPALQVWPLRGLAVLYGICLLAAPSVLMHARLGDASVVAFDLHATLALVGVLVVAWGRTGPMLFQARHYLVLAAGLLVVLAAITGVVLLHGTTPRGLLDGVLLNPLRVGALWGTTPRWFRSAWPIALVFDALALVWLLAERAGRGSHRAWVLLLAAGRLGFALSVLIWLTKLRYEVARELLTWAVPATWMVLIPADRAQSPSGEAFGRRFLAFLAVTQTLWIYPVPGSQRGFAAFLADLALVVIACDGMRDFVAASDLSTRLPGRLAVRTLQATAVAWLLWIYSSEAVVSYLYYLRRVPLDLPGARAIHVDPRTFARYHQLVDALEHRPDTFFTLPGMYSLHLWTQREPVTTYNLTNWMYMLDGHRQSQIVAHLGRDPGVCVVVNPVLVHQWMEGRPLPSTPLIRYLDAHFVRLRKIGDFEIRVRKELVRVP